MKNDVIEIEITDITPEGFGVGRHDGKVVFVADTAVGDKAGAIVMKELKNRSFAKVFEILSPSPDRIDSDCAVSRKCGGCAFRHISYEAEKALKRKFVGDAMKRIGNLDIEIKETVSANPENYRNKVQYPFSMGKNGECIYGYYARRSHRIIEYNGCKLQEPIFEQIASFTAETANKLFIPPYDETNGKGVLRHIVMRKNRKGEVLVCLVVARNNRKIPVLADAIAEKFGNIVGIHQNINKRRDNVIFGDETEKLVGAEVLRDTLCGKTFEISPRSFYQVNADMAEKLYTRAKELLNEREKPSIILDLYCGAGTIGLCVADEGDMLCGVEIIDSAVENANVNAKLNGRNEKNTLFVCGDASLGVNECKKKFGTPDTIIVDPPRKGLEKEVIETVVNASPKQVLYISCDPATLARDCKIFAEYGYKTDKAEPFDLFPRTGHVETVVLLERTVSSI